MQEGWVIGAIVTLGILLYVVFKPFSLRKLVFLNPAERQQCRLVEKEHLSPDTRRFRFALPSASHSLGLPVGKHIVLSATINGDHVARPYTPVTSDVDLGHFDVVVKVYFKGVHPKFPDGGKLSQYLESLNIGDSIDVKGPIGSLAYVGGGTFSLKNGTQQRATKIGMIAGGTGITPMLQIYRAIRRASEDIEVSLLFANQTESDILLRKELDAEMATNSNLKVWYTLDRPPQGWAFSEGFVTAEMVEQHLPAAGPDAIMLICGPPPMIKFACLPSLQKLGWADDRILTF